ncbi:lysin [Lactobacillus amylovorus subsp. animalium]|uniref:GH25 family lysozyme n=1 Tax=Lactobacillus amylovorus TaxID=1604 RepID=UPI0010AC3C7F|nr:GH25 family lysozyme [Lactobacillus amylovorus]TJY06245.1 lysin [Lactobacillus amylovorus]
MANREYLVDVSAYQGTSMAQYHSRGATGIIVKGTEGQWYRNPLAVKQIASAHYHHMWVHMYHFANFGHSVHQAKLEARACLAEAKHLNINKKRYIFCDWEASAQNYIQGSRLANTKAVLAFMKVCHGAGYHVGLYSGASALRNNVDASTIVKKYGACLWVASYATMGRIDTPSFAYFPSMNGVAMWQFTDNWHGLNVDGNITLIDLHAENKAKPAKEIPKIVYVPIINNNPNYHVRLLDSKGHYQKYIATNTRWKVWSVKIINGMKCYKIGTDTQWVPAKFTKIIK